MKDKRSKTIKGKQKMSSYKVEIIIRPNSRIKSRQWWNQQSIKLGKLFFKALPKNKIIKFKSSSYTLLITKDKEIQGLNNKFRKINRPTDVLSFHLNKNEQLNKKYLGDIVISIETAKKQAMKKRISPETELTMLCIHGYLHLLGYDHKLTKDAKTMFSLQNKLLRKMT